MQTLRATRYVTPLREGGSLPAIVEAEDDGLYVLKFRGAGQGPKALIAELVCGELARHAGLRGPEIVLMDLDPALGRNEADYEIRQLITASEGLNLALDYLPGSLSYDPIANAPQAATLASKIVCFDAFVTNVDRTARNTNMLVWHKNLWLIDHGAALFFHHTPPPTPPQGEGRNKDESRDAFGWMEKSKSPFAQIKDHVLLPLANDLQSAESEMCQVITAEAIEFVTNLIPDSWLEAGKHFATAGEYKSAYRDYLVSRLEHSHIFTTEAIDARAKLV